MTRLLCLAMGMWFVALAGCELPVSVHPLSDEKTSILDERLIGHWEMIPPPDREPEPNAAPQRWTFGRVADKPNLLECVALELEGDGHVKVHRIPLFLTKLGDLRYLSVVMNPEDPQEKRVYLILLYELKDEKEARFYLLSKDVIGPAIEREDIAGIVKKQDPDPDDPPPELVKPKYREVRITAEPKELAAYLQRRGKAAFNTEGHVTLRRIEVQ